MSLYSYNVKTAHDLRNLQGTCLNMNTIVSLQLLHNTVGKDCPYCGTVVLLCGNNMNMIKIFFLKIWQCILAYILVVISQPKIIKWIALPYKITIGATQIL